jgi:hypothetical protein
LARKQSPRLARNSAVIRRQKSELPSEQKLACKTVKPVSLFQSTP